MNRGILNVSGARLIGSQYAGLEAFGVGAVMTAVGVEVADTRRGPVWEFTAGVSVGRQAQATVIGLWAHGNDHVQLSVDEAGSHVSLIDGLLEGERQSDELGMFVGPNTSATIDTVRIHRARDSGLLVSGPGSTLAARDLTVTSVMASEPELLVGLTAIGLFDTTADLMGVRLSHNVGNGIGVQNSVVRVAGVLVEDTRAHADGRGGGALQFTDGTSVVVSGARLVDHVAALVSAVHFNTALSWTGGDVRRTQLNFELAAFSPGFGIVALSGARVDLAAIYVEDTHSSALGYFDQSAGSCSHCVFNETREAIAESQGVDSTATFADGIMVENSTVLFDHVAAIGNVRVGLLAKGATIALTAFTSVGNLYGAVLQDGSTVTVSGDVLYRENELGDEIGDVGLSVPKPPPLIDPQGQ